MIPGYRTTTEAAEELGMSRQHFHQSGLAEAIPSYAVARTHLYASEDIARWATWLAIRRGLIALGVRPANTPLNIGHSPVADVVDTGEWEGQCPLCGGWAVTDTRLNIDDDRVWCPDHGIQPSTL